MFYKFKEIGDSSNMAGHMVQNYGCGFDSHQPISFFTT
jgi:hypothetical protein